MKIRLEQLPLGGQTLAVLRESQWVPLTTVAAALGSVSPKLTANLGDMITFLEGGPSLRAEVEQLLTRAEPLLPGLSQRPPPTVLLPFQPRSFRDFMLYEGHVTAASRGYAKRFLPKLWPFLNAYEKIVGKPHPKLRPKPLWYEHPIYYMGSHINVFGDGDTVPWPNYCSALDYELELGVIVTQTLYNATPEEACEAIGGFVVLNDFSARDCQLAEMTSGFGPVKAKNFANSISSCVVEARDILPRIDELAVNVKINGKTVAESTTQGMYYTLGEMVSYASRGEKVVPGELMGTGTIPGCCALENGHWLQPNDTITLTIDRIGSLTNQVGSPQPRKSVT